MSVMSDLDLMVREGERTADDFIGRGFDARTARAMAEVVAASNVEPSGKLSGDELANVWAREELAASKRRTAELGYCPKCSSELDDGFACLGECL